ncbi:MAG: thioredoxin [Tenericutes bacterium]|nr:thioredoxin [Mycoplasmatota bacterium]
MEIIHANEENFNDLIMNGKVLVDFFATWCGPCKMLTPILEELASDRSDTKIVKVDVDECEGLARQFGVMSIPTLIQFDNGKIIDKKVGFQSKEEISEWLK